ncbi:rhodanese-like domain-containing protein [Geomonas sp. Red69]|uniref:Rhodanese-like domain-containing protein n=1 Tax=Geomonas diazotrophica TaxID=2843197 RepID=A0ABX8JJ87_9BACT|nr:MULTISPECIES: rhodanese-like domain-containing protein [Geomonas]MBU5635733.1 rhodanese-like domain-containing protein [Geomonas diazotrophica]QWV98031.1 rhodanese-like domain-containing protein [Geomonas nitrogeniifigens]QXE87162.1 rhodanese-like domain-containing protein [Geomonas nitrogeniifigens]
MAQKSSLKTVLEIAVIVFVSAVFGIFWNRTLLADAWRGAPAAPQAAPAAQQAEALPMPIGLAQVKELHDSGQAVLVDARSGASFAKEHISGARSLPLEEATRQRTPQLEGVAKDAVVIAYCNGFSCHDSMDLGKLLIKAGYGSVYVFEGGLPEWRDSGYPTSGGAR